MGISDPLSPQEPYTLHHQPSDATQCTEVAVFQSVHFTLIAHAERCTA